MSNAMALMIELIV
jgi:hypothetical protein